MSQVKRSVSASDSVNSHLFGMNNKRTKIMQHTPTKANTSQTCSVQKYTKNCILTGCSYIKGSQHTK